MLSCVINSTIQSFYCACCNLGLQMIDDDLNSGQSSPPPPAPNGENASTEIFQPTIDQQQRPIQNVSWNPFCTPAIQQPDSHSQISSMNPFAADLMKQQVFVQNEQQTNKKIKIIDGDLFCSSKTENMKLLSIIQMQAFNSGKQIQPQQHQQQQQSQNYLSSGGICSSMELSPKKTKSDSGLSSMSGFSSLEKSPNSPSHKPRIPAAHLQTHFITTQQVPSYSLPYNNETKARRTQDDKTDYEFSEENLNYIRELSKNVPICSVFENKSMFNVGQSQMAQAHNFSYDQLSQQPRPLSPINMTYYKVPDNISYDFPLSDNEFASNQNHRKSYTDVVSVHRNISTVKCHFTEELLTEIRKKNTHIIFYLRSVDVQ